MGGNRKAQESGNGKTFGARSQQSLVSFPSPFVLLILQKFPSALGIPILKSFQPIMTIRAFFNLNDCKNTKALIFNST
jgi:hypothetical protein